MDREMRTAEKFMQTVNAMKNSLDTEGIEKHLDLEIAVRHNLRRKLRMIHAVQGLYRHLHGDGKRPVTLPSAVFDPFDGIDRTNIHYIFKAMSKTAPWDMPKDVLALPTAATLYMIEVVGKLFPGPEIFRYRLLVEEFVNRWTLPKFRPEWSKSELARQIARYRDDMNDFEKRFKDSYAALAVFFGAIEKPEKDPTKLKITETHKRTKAIAAKVCGKEKNASFVAQEKALNIWKEYKNAPEVRNRYCTKDHRVSYADVFDYCRRQITDAGIKTAVAFEKAVKAAQKRAVRVGKETRKHA